MSLEWGKVSYRFMLVSSVLNSQDPSLSAGGSSGGSAVAVANGDCFGALGTDTGGSVRLPAAYNGIVGFKPSYGTISRYGVIAYANSMDTVGILAGNCTDAASIFDAVDAYDSNDPTSLLPTIRRRMRESEKSLMERKTFSIGVPSQLNLHELTSDIRAAWLRALLNLQQLGHTIHEVSIPAAKLALPAYYILAPAEASSNLAKYDGVRFGNEMADPLEPAHVLYASTRGLGLGEEVRRRILLGAYSLSATAIDNYFIQAQRVRNMVLQDFDQVFNLVNPLHSMQVQPRDNAVDFLLSPTATTPPPKVENLDERAPTEAYSDDVLTVPASLAGLPAVNIPYFQISNPTGAGRGGNALIGLQLIGQFGTDRSLLKAGRHLEQAFRSDDERPPT
ncbi:Trimeric GatFAB AmidoTransferase(AdT) complex subunit [Agyrium rufum]|nr:Trimeric GatFAB AmidoTransferase(AdT) complex subunit [Agyrium rufum]